MRSTRTNCVNCKLVNKKNKPNELYDHKSTNKTPLSETHKTPNFSASHRFWTQCWCFSQVMELLIVRCRTTLVYPLPSIFDIIIRSHIVNNNNLSRFFVCYSLVFHWNSSILCFNERLSISFFYTVYEHWATVMEFTIGSVYIGLYNHFVLFLFSSLHWYLIGNIHKRVGIFLCKVRWIVKKKIINRLCFWAKKQWLCLVGYFVSFRKRLRSSIKIEKWSMPAAMPIIGLTQPNDMWFEQLT